MSFAFEMQRVHIQNKEWTILKGDANKPSSASSKMGVMSIYIPILNLGRLGEEASWCSSVLLQSSMLIYVLDEYLLRVSG